MYSFMFNRSCWKEDAVACSLYTAWSCLMAVVPTCAIRSFRFTGIQSSYLAIRVMETTQNREGNDLSLVFNLRACCIPWLRNLLVDALMRSRLVEILHVLVEDPPQVRDAEDHHMVEAFTPDAP